MDDDNHYPEQSGNTLASVPLSNIHIYIDLQFWIIVSHSTSLLEFKDGLVFLSCLRLAENTSDTTELSSSIALNVDFSSKSTGISTSSIIFLYFPVTSAFHRVNPPVLDQPIGLSSRPAPPFLGWTVAAAGAASSPARSTPLRGTLQGGHSNSSSGKRRRGDAMAES